MDENLTDDELTEVVRQDLAAWEREVVKLQSQLAYAQGHVAELQLALAVRS